MSQATTRLGRRFTFAALSATFAAAIAILPGARAHAAPSVLGYQYSNRHAGLVGRVWAYPWQLTETSSEWAAHVSSLYINADGLDGTTFDNYVEAGLERNSLTALADSRPVFFIAYEDYPNTQGQVWDSYGYATLNQWHDVKIANYQPYTGAPSDWAVYFNGTARMSKGRMSFKVGQPITASERLLYLDGNLSSFDNMKNRLITGTHAEWTSIATRDRDPLHRPLIVDGSAWRCIWE